MIDPDKYVKVKSLTDGKLYRYYGVCHNKTNPHNISPGVSNKMALYKINSDAAAQGGDILLTMEMNEFQKKFEFH